MSFRSPSRRKWRTILTLLVCFPLVFSLTACDGDTSVTLPTEPTMPPDDDGGGDPPGNNSAVFPQGSGSCPTAGPCIADFSVSLRSDETVSWVFTGGQPPTSGVGAGQVRWPSPGSYNWTSTVCNTASLCTDAQGTVSFTDSGDGGGGG